jgi:putative membrane protein
MKNLFLIGAGLIAPVFSAFAEIPDMDDAQIADVVITANNIVIQAGKLAHSRSSDQKIKEYAKRMIGEHAVVNGAATELTARLNLTARNNPISNALRTGSEKNIAELASLHGKEFDKAYIDQAVILHQDILDTIDNRLVPYARSEDLKALLYNLFSPLSDHLEQAQEIRESLNKKRRTGLNARLMHFHSVTETSS